MQIKDFPELMAAGSNDLLLIQTADDNAYRKIKKSNIATSSTQNEILTNNLVVDYRFDQMQGQQLTDYSVNGFHATLANSNQPNAQSPQWLEWANSGLDFVNDDFVQAPNQVFFQNDLTIETCFLVRSYADWARVIDFGNGEFADNVLISISAQSSGRPVFATYNAGNGSNLTASYSLPLNKFVYLQATLQGESGTLFLNLEPIASNNNMAIPRNVIRNNCFIARSNWADAYFDGVITCLRIYNKALNRNERINNFIYTRRLLESKGIIL